MTEPPNRITDTAALKVFTHPLRIELLRVLSAVRVATASQLAERVDEAVSLVSYHLRKMAEHGFIAETGAPEGRACDGRERWWTPSERPFSFRSSDFDDRPEGAAVAAQVVRRLLEKRSEQYSAFLDTAASWPRAWMDAAFTSEYFARLTAAELAECEAEFAEVAQRWRERGRAAEAAGDTEDREHVALHLYGFPFRP
ncbi:winged helix-turn-helix domain-containing protein [Streptomyces boncukensis]|uniref:Helix-turn-helix transcriptional regulator n=1 Tax=Streptomyces boncukensis TaxID=2711219 RepID=A0A6G4WXH9_9ACTN|nr:helix-turn-helix domain-containing protein [Streptomyces boncukensis]NGO69713.1 helix-turn-helix transcriptional regulator [Streptomyces boncukensis]